MKTYSAKPAEVRRDWVVIDASNQVLGRMAAEIARRLRGKHKPVYTPHVDTGDYVVVINAEKVHLTGNKEDQKRYFRHTGRPGSLKQTSAAGLRKTRPEDVIRHAVKGMLPKNPLGRAMFAKLKVYAGEKHPHQAQRPANLQIRG